MTVQEKNWLLETFRFVDLFRTSSSFRDQVTSQGYTYNSRHIFFYINQLVSFSARYGNNNYSSYYSYEFAKEARLLTPRYIKNWDQFSDKLANFFNRCSADSNEYGLFARVASDPQPLYREISDEDYRKLMQAQIAHTQGQEDLLLNNVLAGPQKRTVSSYGSGEEVEKENTPFDQAKIGSIKERLSQEWQKALKDPNYFSKENQNRLLEDGVFTQSEFDQLKKLFAEKGDDRGKDDERLQKLAEGVFDLQKNGEEKIRERERIARQKTSLEKVMRIPPAISAPPLPTTSSSRFPERLPLPSVFSRSKIPEPLKNAALNVVSNIRNQAVLASGRQPKLRNGLLAGSLTGLVTFAFTRNLAASLAAGVGAGSAAAAFTKNPPIIIEEPEITVTSTPVSGSSSGIAGVLNRIPLTSTAPSLKVPSLKIWIIGFGVVLFVLLGFVFPDLMKQLAFFPPWEQATNFCPNANVSVAGSCPVQSEIDANKRDRNSCRGLKPAINIFDTQLNEDKIQYYINKYQPQSRLDSAEFERRVKIIVRKSQEVGLNPAIYLGLWKSETGFGATLGCAPTQGVRSFEEEVSCGVGLSAQGGAAAARCATSKDANSQACKLLKGVRESHPDKYANYPLSFPITSFDDLMEAYGPFTPNLGDAAQNNNCTHSYNTVLEVAMELGSCKAISSQLASLGSLAECKFSKGDQNPKELPYQSQKLLSYFQEVSQKTGVPATVLAGVARVESTTGRYTISNYSDEDISKMEEYAKSSISDYDKTIEGTQRALCPQSPTGALGIMQIQPPGTTGHSPDSITNGAKFIGKTVNSLKKEEYCDPKTSIYLAAGFILKKMQSLGYGDGNSWQEAWSKDKKYFDAVASSYYGCLRYPSCQSGPNSYGDDLWNSFNSCKSTTIQSATVAQQGAKKVVVLDPGHCSNDKYGEKKVPENTLNLQQANVLANMLSQKGIDAKVYNPNGDGSCKEDDYYANLQARVNFANNIKADAYISIHGDSGVQDDTFNPIYSQRGPFSQESIQLGKSMGQGVVDSLKASGRQTSYHLSESTETGTGQGGGEYYVLGPKGSKTAGLYGGKITEIQNQRNMPGVIMENYMKTSSDYKSIFPYINSIALGYCNGISNYFGLGDCQASTNTSQQIATQSNSANLTFDISCPVPNGRVTCGSYGKVEPWGGFDGTCRPDSGAIGGHCNANYRADPPVGVGICKIQEMNGNLIRTAKSIDVTAAGGNRAGDPIYLPTIKGKQLNWEYKGQVSADRSSGTNFGFIRLFQSEQTEDGVWSIQFVHSNSNNPPLEVGQTVKSGEVGATMFNLGSGIHTHVTIGLNVGDSTSDLKDYSPNWLYADRDLGMCTDGRTDPVSNLASLIKGATAPLNPNLTCSQQPVRPGPNPSMTNGQFYCQRDPRWAKTPTAGSCDLGYAGCGPTTLAMALTRLGGDIGGEVPTPPVVDKLFQSINARVCASDMRLVWPWLEGHGYDVKDVKLTDSKLDLEDAERYLNNKYLIVGSMHNHPIGGDHIFGISGVDKTLDKVRQFDPVNCTNNTDEGAAIYIDNSSSYDWFFAKAIKKL